jgi:hypothetical protein
VRIEHGLNEDQTAHSTTVRVERAGGGRSGRQTPVPKIVGDKPRRLVRNVVDPSAHGGERDEAVMLLNELVVIRYSPAQSFQPRRWTLNRPCAL